MFDPCAVGRETDMTQNACTRQTLAILYRINGMMQNNCGHSKCVSLLYYFYRDPWGCNGRKHRVQGYRTLSLPSQSSGAL